MKTRIAATEGNKSAVRIYKKLLQHTHAITEPLEVDKFIFYGDFINPTDLWQVPYDKALQHGADLGERMKNAFATLFAKGYNKVVIIGSDCYELDTTTLQRAFECLQNNRVVLGPSFDGGYYLLGLNKALPEIFDNIKWSTSTVYSDTLNFITNGRYSYTCLQQLNDVDTREDCLRYPGFL